MKGDTKGFKQRPRIKLDEVVAERRRRHAQPDILDVWKSHKKITAAQRVSYRAKTAKKKLNTIFKVVKNKSFSSYFIFLKSNKFKSAKVYVFKHKIYALAIVVISATLMLFIGSDSPKKSTLGSSTSNTNSLAASDSQQNQENPDNAVPDDNLDFDELTPNGVKLTELASYKVRKTPADDVILSFQDQRDSLVIEVTEQKIPDSFRGKVAEQTEKIAKDLQATDIIQIDDIRIYHGVSEKTGVQSLVTTKKDLLIFMRSDVKQSDEFWAAYYLSLM
jgi:hypothetical protein